MKKVFISVGRRGRRDDDVCADLVRARDNIEKLFGYECRTEDNWCCVGLPGDGRLWYLGQAIKKMDGCDACYFCKGWQKHKGCIAEMEICKIYGIKIIEES